MSGVVSAKRGNGNGNGNGGGGGKSGGRGQTSDPVELDEPFTVEKLHTFETNASCMSDESEDVHYTRYSFEYCNADIGPDDKTLCVRPGRSDLDEDRVYEFRSAQDCKAPSSDFQTRFSFGPSNAECDADR